MYCEKTVLVLVNTTTDMSLTSLTPRLKKMLVLVRYVVSFFSFSMPCIAVCISSFSLLGLFRGLYLLPLFAVIIP